MAAPAAPAASSTTAEEEEESHSDAPASIFVFDPRTHAFDGDNNCPSYPPYLSAGGGLQVKVVVWVRFTRIGEVVCRSNM